jgi:HlyD family secretion protein
MIKRILFSFTFLLFTACTEKNSVSYQGYAEGEYLIISSAVGGALEKLNVDKGDSVKGGDILFTIEDDFNSAALSAAKAGEIAATAELADAKSGARVEELAIIRSRLAGAEAALRLSSAQLARDETQFRSGSVTQARLDQSRAAFEQNDAMVKTIRDELKAANLASRPERIKALEARLSAAKAAVSQAEWNLSKNKVISPADGIITEVIRREGEILTAGAPALQILREERIKARFFVPYEKVSRHRIGDLFIAKDVEASLPCRLSYISPKPEYTPPVIYSNSTNKKLAFMFECVPNGGKLVPGAPLTIFPTAED